MFLSRHKDIEHSYDIIIIIKIMRFSDSSITPTVCHILYGSWKSWIRFNTSLLSFKQFNWMLEIPQIFTRNINCIFMVMNRLIFRYISLIGKVWSQLLFLGTTKIWSFAPPLEAYFTPFWAKEIHLSFRLW